MSGTQKLTKKQKKGLAFRERKTGKRHDLSEMEANAIPAVEDQDLAGADGDAIEVAGSDYKKAGKAVDNAVGDEGKRKESKVGSKGKGKAERQDVPVPVEVVKKEKKRKREGAQDSEDSQSKKRKRVDDNDKTPGDLEKAGKQRFILFVGK
jgi:nucleolar protein 6